jgi:hypothetical protein
MWSSGPTRKLHLFDYCTSAMDVDEVEVVLTDLAVGRICGTCLKVLDWDNHRSTKTFGPLSYVTEGTELIERLGVTRHLRDAVAGGGMLTLDQLAELRQLSDTLTPYHMEYGSYLSGLRAEIAGGVAELLEHGITHGARDASIRYCAAFLGGTGQGIFAELSGDKRLAELLGSDKQYYGSPLHSARKVYVRALRDSAGTDEAATLAFAAVEAEAEFPDKVSLLPERPDLSLSDYKSVQEWAQAVWWSETARRCRDAIHSWSEATEQATEAALGEPSVLVARSSYARGENDLLAPFPRATCGYDDRYLVYLVPPVVAEVISPLERSAVVTHTTVNGKDPEAVLALCAGLWQPLGDDALCELEDALVAAQALIGA